MFGKAIPLFRIFGFQIKLDPSWFLLALLITWSLAQGLFPMQHPNLPGKTYWWMGAIGALGLFFSIIFHELSHSLVARRYDLPMKGITLFIFGGVAEMEREPAQPRAEFWMAIAGPVSSVLLAGIFYAVNTAGSVRGWPESVAGVLSYLAFINLLLAAFNMIPAFPLDGGRILRAALWSWKRNMRWATAVSSRVGSGFGLLLIFLGVFTVLMGNFLSGMWWFLIGMFLRNASMASYRQVLLRESLRGEPVSRFMKSQPVSVPAWISIREAVEQYFYRHQFKAFPVVSGARLIGCVSTRRIKEVPQSEWNAHSIAEILEPCGPENTISPDEDAMRALATMSQTGNSRLMVVDRGGRLTGIIALKDLMRFLAIKLELEGEEPRELLPDRPKAA